MCAERGVESVVLIGHAGKLIKVAAGIFNTHSRFGDARLETVAALAAAEGAPAPLVVQLLALPTCEAAVPVLAEAGLARVWDAIAERAAQRATQHAGLPVTCAVVGYDRAILGRGAALRTAETGSSLHVVGVGPGTAEWLMPAVWQAMRCADVVVGGRRHLEQYAPSTAERIPIGADIATVMDAIRARREQRIVVLASGDPGCYGILATIRRELPEMTPTVIPGISSMQLALARLGEAWEGVIFASAHGRAIEEVVRTVAAHPRVLALTDHQHPAQALARALLDAGLDRRMVVLERLGYADERITSGTVDEIAAGSFDALAVVWMVEEDA
jgi:precorrin-6y C5,15-methyltransferase (decarboxylating) CbiE subunit